MRILHTSDWHLGISLGNIPLIDDQRHFINQLIEIIRTEGIDLVLLAGDIYDTVVSKSEAIRLYNDALTAICGELKVPMIIIAGNHDGAERLAALRALLKENGLHITGRLEGQVEQLAIGDADFWPIPHFTIDELRAFHPDVKIESYQQAFALVCDGIRKRMDRNRKNLVLAHAFVRGAHTSESDKTAAIGTADQISADVFRDFDYVALGHLHGPQDVGKNLRYSGTPLKYSASEAGHNKSLTLLDTETMKRTTIPILPRRDLRIIRGSYEQIMKEASYSEDYIKVEVEDRILGIEDLEAFRELYPNLFAIRGRQLELEGAEISLTIEEVKNLSPEEIMGKFFQENFDFVPDEEQLKLFREALKDTDKGGDLS